MDTLWERMIWPLLSLYSPDCLCSIDFACGRGRNARKLRQHGATELTLVDVNAENLCYCKESFRDCSGVSFLQTNGYDLSALPDATFSHIYTFDAMVHFDPEIILSYIADFSRVSKLRGTVFVHHSNFDKAPGVHFKLNPHWRNFMSARLFKHISIRNGFDVLDQRVIDWGVEIGLDCLTVLQRR